VEFVSVVVHSSFFISFVNSLSTSETIGLTIVSNCGFGCGRPNEKLKYANVKSLAIIAINTLKNKKKKI
jgi:hypothetical protein